MVLNRQAYVSVSLPAVRAFVDKLRKTLRLGPREFNVCFVNDREIRRLNTAYRGKPRPTDVLAFPWQEVGKGAPTLSRQVALPQDKITGAPAMAGKLRAHRQNKGNDCARDEFKGFLGDVVISAETARRQARAEGHSTPAEMRRLILHGFLHLLGYDHETDNGEMTRLECSLRVRLGL